MKVDVGRFYLRHRRALASTSELLTMAVELALADLDAGQSERFARRLARIRRSLRFETGPGPSLAATVLALHEATRAARHGEPEAARRFLEPLLAAARPRSSVGLG